MDKQETLFEKALAFAARAHAGQTRKGKETPYILHPCEAAQIVSSMTDDEELWCAALLHDVIEDCNVSYETICEQFGTRIADLVRNETHEESEDPDPMKRWKSAKRSTVDKIRNGSRDEKIVALGDKLSNIRDIERDYLLLGDDLWSRFSVKDPYAHKWYYAELVKALRDLSGTPAYEEFRTICRKVFSKAAPGRQRKGDMSRSG